MGIFLLLLDLLLITFTHGPQYIFDYLQFNRLVSDTGFAGRWVLTVYLFFATGFIISIYLLVRNLIKSPKRVAIVNTQRFSKRSQSLSGPSLPVTHLSDYKAAH